MGKYLKKIESDTITGVYSNEQLSIMNHYRHQMHNGPTTMFFKNPKSEKFRVVFTGTDEVDDITNFEWEFGQDENNHPCVFITFNAINPILLGNQEDGSYYCVCLETNSQGTKGKNRCLIVSPYTTLDFLIPLNEIIIGKQYKILFYKDCRQITHRSHALNLHRDIPEDWVITMNIRPCFRLVNHNIYPNDWMKPIPLKYMKYKVEYEQISFLYKDLS